MSTDLRHMRIIIAAADCGSFSSAALQLNAEISAISRAVRDVEDALGVAIFERLPRGVRLTLGGDAYVAEARDILSRVAFAEQLARDAGNNGAGALNVGVFWPVTCRPVSELLAAFTLHHPHVLLSVSDDVEDALLVRVRSGELHAALTTTNPATRTASRSKPGLDSFQLWSESLAVAVPASESIQTIAWADVAERSLLCRPRGDWRKVVSHVERLGGPTLHFIEQDVSVEGLLALVGAGLGWALVPGSLAGAAAVGAKLVPITSPGATFRAEAIWMKRTPSSALKLFVTTMHRLHGGNSSDALSRIPDQSP